jgi:hypothetical protein
MLQPESFKWTRFVPLFGVGSALTVIQRYQNEINAWRHLPNWIYTGALVLELVS